MKQLILPGFEVLADPELPQNLVVYWHHHSGGGGNFTHASDGAEFHRLDDAVRYACELMEQAMRENADVFTGLDPDDAESTDANDFFTDWDSQQLNIETLGGESLFHRFSNWRFSEDLRMASMDFEEATAEAIRREILDQLQRAMDPPSQDSADLDPCLQEDASS